MIKCPMCDGFGWTEHPVRPGMFPCPKCRGAGNVLAECSPPSTTKGVLEAAKIIVDNHTPKGFERVNESEGEK